MPSGVYARAVRTAGRVALVLLITLAAAAATDRVAPVEEWQPRKLVSGPGVSVLELRQAFRLGNRQGAWRVEKACRRAGHATVGPGYVSAAVAFPRTVLVDDLREPGPLNDPRYGGLGAFGWHHVRGVPGATRLGARNAWEVSGRDCARANGGFGVAGSRVVNRPSAADGRLVLDVLLSDRFTYPRPLVRVRYAYRLRPERLETRVTVTSLCDHGRCGRTRLRAFVKEPKVVASLRGPVFRTATFDDGGRMVCRYRGSGPAAGPLLSSGQCGADRRARVRFEDPRGDCDRSACLEVEARGASGLWEGSGFDRWALAAASRPWARPRDSGSVDGLVWGCNARSPGAAVHRRWETVARLAPGAGAAAAVSVLFPAWEGGRGGYDCEPLARLFGPYGESYTVRLTYRIV